MKIEKGLILTGKIESIKEINDEIEIMLKDANDEIYYLKTKDFFHAKKNVEVSLLVNDDKTKIISLITHKKVLIGNFPLLYAVLIFKSILSAIRWIFLIFIIILLLNTVTEGVDGFMNSLFMPMMIPILWGDTLGWCILGALLFLIFLSVFMDVKNIKKEIKKGNIYIYDIKEVSITVDILPALKDEDSSSFTVK